MEEELRKWPVSFDLPRMTPSLRKQTIRRVTPPAAALAAVVVALLTAVSPIRSGDPSRNATASMGSGAPAVDYHVICVGGLQGVPQICEYYPL